MPSPPTKHVVLTILFFFTRLIIISLTSLLL